MFYLDVKSPIQQFQMDRNSKIYVDKSLLIEKMSELINTNQRFVCITRPRRFGKSMNATMLGAYFMQGYDSHELFDDLLISKTETYEKHLNKHHVIYIDFSRMPDPCDTYKDYIEYVKMQLFSDLHDAYGIEKQPGLSMNDYLNKTDDSFIFILDEWDSIFYKKFMDEDDKIAYLEFLNGLLKGQPYVELVYMTGVLPIAKYSSGSALNTFKEYNFMNDQIYDIYFGFSEDEVHNLCNKYNTISYDELKYWYDGYKLQNGQSLFNPRSVCNALTDGVCLNYWTETGPMNEISNCIGKNVDDVKEDMVKLVSNIPLENEELSGYSATESKLETRDEVLSAMVVYGFLSYKDNTLKIPNHELMLKFQKVLKRDNMGQVAEIVNASKDMLEATINKDSDTVAKYLEEVHDREIPFFNYDNENSLSCVITLCYLQARNVYEITREDKSGKGYVDFLFKPLKAGYPAIVMELKHGHSAEEAIKQIKEKKYVDRVRDCKEILLVGINYSETDNKKHTCIIEQYK